MKIRLLMTRTLGWVGPGRKREITRVQRTPCLFPPAVVLAKAQRCPGKPRPSSSRMRGPLGNGQYCRFFNGEGVPACARTTEIWGGFAVTDFKSHLRVNARIDGNTALKRESPIVSRTAAGLRRDDGFWWIDRANCRTCKIGLTSPPASIGSAAGHRSPTSGNDTKDEDHEANGIAGGSPVLVRTVC